MFLRLLKILKKLLIPLSKHLLHIQATTKIIFRTEMEHSFDIFERDKDAQISFFPFAYHFISHPVDLKNHICNPNGAFFSCF